MKSSLLVRIACIFVMMATAASADLPDGFIIQTHRCAGALGPENTLESCFFAWQLGTIPEVDVRTAADGVLVAFHDKNFERVVKDLPQAFEGKGIEDFSYEDLQELDVGVYKGEYFEGQRIPQLSAIFHEMQMHPQYRLYLDIKDVSLQTLAALAMDYELGSRVILASTHYEMIQQWNELVPNAQTLLWMGGTEVQLRERMVSLKAEGFIGITQLQIHVRRDASDEDPNSFYPSPAFLREVANELASRGIVFQSLPWMADEQIYATLLSLGVNSFATDYPQRTTRAVSNYQETSNSKPPSL